MLKVKEVTKFPAAIKWFSMTKIFLIILLVSLPFSFAENGAWPSFFLALIVLIGLPASVYLLLWYDSMSFVVEEKTITINSGIIVRKSKVIPFDKIQSVNCVQGPLMGIFKLSKVNIWTAAPAQINISNGQSENRPDGVLFLMASDAEWLKGFVTSLDK